MSFISVTTYAVECDACGQRFLGHEGEQFGETEAAIDEMASSYRWVYLCGQHICSDCHDLRGIEPGDVAEKAVGV